MNSAIFYGTDGTVVKLDHKPTLEECQQMVGGWIELVHRTIYNPAFEGQMVVNEEGLLKGLPINKVGTRLYGSPHSPIVSNVVILTGKWKLD